MFNYTCRRVVLDRHFGQRSMPMYLGGALMSMKGVRCDVRDRLALILSWVWLCEQVWKLLHFADTDFGEVDGIR